jgi:hypothetical protein
MDTNLNRTRSIAILGASAFLILGCAVDGDTASETDESTAPASSALLSAQPGDDAWELGVLARSRCPHDLPAVLDAPADATLVAVLPARGVQIYTCTAATAGAAPAWTLKAPHAVLGKGSEVAAIHFAGPSWQATDGSLVTGLKVAAAASPDATAIPWLLLKAVSNAGQGIFRDVTFIQRLNTDDGIAPATGCDDAHLDAQVLSPYRADYFFYHTAAAGARVRQCASP